MDRDRDHRRRSERSASAANAATRRASGSRRAPVRRHRGMPRKLINGGSTHATVLAIGLTVSAIVLMPLLGWAKLRLGRRLASGATTGVGIQNILCAVQAATALIAVAAAGIGLPFLDPVAALVIAAIAMKEGRDGWRGQSTCCTPMPGLADTDRQASCQDECCAS